MTGRIALHGGGEYVAGDERAMDALVAAAVEAARARGSAGPVRVVVVPAAAARQHPGLAGAHGEHAFRAAAGRADAALEVEVALVVDLGSAASPVLAARLAAADLVHLPGGDPDVIPALFPASAAWRAIEDAWRRGACLAGASAGAMALCDRCWTPRGAVAGLGLVPGWAVLPHFGPGRPAAWGDAFGSGASRPAFLGLEERTLVIGRPGGPWRVAGAGRAHLVPPGADAPTASAADGEALPG